ncbi:zipper-like transcriptional regulator 1 [Seminavis robusta]|uniref:Zipper-like transcriptional regulator 1 n=1 Tax=Seminavis robusta TaxID=568900 RepID=A0A9N8DWD4_9STRA|nr:zipper-like transcriptional regulator 1 [Seminavis robusta]|eukprot:Sro413_g138050.1 zipper-like transcriptional regulator 1 (694) ;mRNA; r:24081-26435
MNNMQWSEQSSSPHDGGPGAPTIKNHSVTHFAGTLYAFGGYDGRRNHNSLLLYSIRDQRWFRPHHVGTGGPDQAAFLGDTTVLVTGNAPPGRNGHSATLAADPDDDENGRIIIIGGWLGTGPLAASDMHVLDIANGGRRLRWYQPAVKGTPPGPCNMHSADYVASKKEVYVFRGGNGREYLNDLHALHVESLTWRRVETNGAVPQQRANHSSAILEDTGELFIFGGWNGTERLNDIHILDTETSTWTCPHIGGLLPHPRAGMTLTALRGRLYLFGGSGTSSKCFQDLQILDRSEMAWLDVTATQFEPRRGMPGNSMLGGMNEHNAAERLMNAHHMNDNTHNDDYNLRWPLVGNIGAGGFHPDHPVLIGNGVVPGHDREMMGDRPTQRYHPGLPHGNVMQPGQRLGAMRSPSLAGGMQDGGGGSSYAPSAQLDWRARDYAFQTGSPSQGGSIVPMAGGGGANPNDEETIPTVLVHGVGPGRRAGHTATAVNRRIYVFGGSCGSDYLNDFFVLDSDPPPHARVTEPTSLQLLDRRLRHFFNDDEFSDVTFIVQGQKVYGHRLVLSIVSDCFRAMFTTGFRESQEMEIELNDVSLEAFLAVMEYIYTGQTPKMDPGPSLRPGPDAARDVSLGRIIEILELADRFFLDHLKQICETMLQPSVSAETVEFLLPLAQKTNAGQLQTICEHFIRNQQEHA